MSDTLQPCLINVTNNNATSLVLPSEDDILSSQNDSDQVPQLSSPSPASTVSSPSSSQVELTNPTNSGDVLIKRTHSKSNVGTTVQRI
ncbi:unnamed protein product [Absidia cylindrospora]